MEPAMADATRALPGNWHDEPSSPSPAPILSCNLGYTKGGSLLESKPGSVSKSAEAGSASRYGTGTPTAIIKVISGHTTAQMLALYSHIGQDAKRQALAKLDLPTQIIQ
jgi:hypothetical protein